MRVVVDQSEIRSSSRVVDMEVRDFATRHIREAVRNDIAKVLLCEGRREEHQ